jgi:hypothetical protein
MSEWDYEVSRDVAGGVFRIKAKAGKDGIVSDLRLEAWCFEWYAVREIYHHNGCILLRYLEGPQLDQLEVKASAIFKIRPNREPFWLSLQLLRKAVDYDGFLTTWRFIFEDLESMVIHALQI